jgi:hypothetical protein
MVNLEVSLDVQIDILNLIHNFKFNIIREIMRQWDICKKNQAMVEATKDVLFLSGVWFRS